MLVAYIALGIASGILAAVLTFVAGHGLLMSIAAYIGVGTTMIVACVLWMLLPASRAAPPVKRHAPQRSKA
jgi:hypothetical protein